MRMKGREGGPPAVPCDGLFWTFREIYDNGMRKPAIAPRERATPAI